MTGFEDGVRLMEDLIRRVYVAAWKAKNRHEDGQTLVEYALILGVLVVGCVASVSFFGTQLQAYYDQIRGAVSAAVP